MRATIRVTTQLVSLIVLSAGAAAERRDNPPTPMGVRDDCVVQIVTTDGHGTTWRTASREACLARAQLAGDQPALTVEDIRRGPGGALALSSTTPEHCIFIPYNMALKGRGRSRKFWCYRTDAQSRYYNNQYALVPEAVGVSATGVLVDARGRALTDALGRDQRPEIIKVKYSDGGDRGREVYTEVAVHRFLWTLGFPTDHMFRTTVECRGCPRDPFNDIRTSAENRSVKGANVFPQASIERKAWAPLDADQDEGWAWEEVYAAWSANPAKRIELEAYVLALNMVHFHNGLAKQNTLACDPRSWDTGTGTCARPVIFLDDPGSSFGGGRTRGDHDTYRGNGVFLDARACTLRADLAGFGRPSEAARRLLLARLNNLTPDGVRAIFESAGFNEETTGASVEVWTTTFLGRIEEVRHASCR
jgi:hypothetical protein